MRESSLTNLILRKAETRPLVRGTGFRLLNKGANYAFTLRAIFATTAASDLI